MQDKETRLRELLRMMGLSDFVYWTNAFLVGLINAFPLCLLVTVSLCTNFGNIATLPHSNAGLVFVALIAYSVGIIFMALLVSVLIRSAKLGALVVILAQSCSLFLMQRLDPLSSSTADYVNGSKFIKLSTSMLSPCGLHWAFKIMLLWERRDIGANWSNLFQPAVEGDTVTLGSILGTMILSWFIWMLVILYLDAVVPWQSGMPKHPLFFLRYSFWFPKVVASDLVRLEDSVDSEEDSFGDDMVESSNAAGVVIRLQGVSHEFGALLAVDNLSLDLYRNQITVLLGHNGAGKTTTMNIMTGLFPPTRGEIYINGHSVRSSTKEARQGVGLCPQHNVLFDDLTVEEHLHFFSDLKSSSSSMNEVRDLMTKLELNAKAGTLSKSLSGGMKRKLSLANAMVGGSSVLILDEPSSGLDPEARRLVWDLLQQERTRRTVLMTTHYMEEADVLGDRIAFLAKGKLMCAGSPMFLKRKFETGYKLRLTKASPNLDPESVVAAVKNQLSPNANNVNLVSDLSYEFVINIGFPGAAEMISLFRFIEDNRESLGIESMGASVTTMEDVFLKVGQREEDLASRFEPESSSRLFGRLDLSVSESFPKFTRLNGSSLILRQMLSLLTMRFRSCSRDGKVLYHMTLVPLIFAIVYVLSMIPRETSSQTKTVTYNINSLLGASRGFLGGSVPDPVADAFTTRLSADGVRIGFLSNLSSTGAVNDFFLGEAKRDLNAFKYHTSAGVVKGLNSIFFNGQPYHVGAAALADWQAARLANLTGRSSSVTVSNHPFEPESFKPPMVSIVSAMRTVGVLFVGIVFAYVSSATIITPIQERVRKSKLIQTMSGVKPIVYIGSNFAFDTTTVFLNLMLCFLVMLCFNPAHGFTTFGETIPASILVFLAFASSATPWAYIFSYLFNNSSTGFSVFNTLNILLVLVAGFSFAILENIPQLIGDRADVYLKFLSFVPVFSATWSFLTVHRNGCVKSVFDEEGIAAICSSPVIPKYISVFCVPCSGESSAQFCFEQHSVFNADLYTGVAFQLVALVLTGCLGFALVMLIELNTRKAEYAADLVKGLLPWRKTSIGGADCGDVPEDASVKAERQAVHEAVAKNQIESFALVVKDVTKHYGSLRAVNNISFSVKKNECFGLLGVNGAGKTTTFSILTGDSYINEGNSYIERTDVRSTLGSYQEYIGYCPQFDALVDTLTGRELLELFCGLRGVPGDEVEGMVNFMTSMADLKPHIDKLTRSYSGGNKRKLSLAIAMIGNPRVLFLDEPTAGVDPGARRRIWATLAQAQRELNSSIVLTSHSMDECEALCHRLVIMFKGTFRCLGSCQQIKSKYGQGFTVSIKTEASGGDQLSNVGRAMEDLFDGRCELKKSYQCMLQFHVNDASLRWSEVFERIQELRENPNLRIEDVQVSDTTLEQVFLNFAQENATESEASGPSFSV
ncbi:ATP-binding cassette sub-family A member 1 [Galendromus occidentalis]|uniref:ATP-binding cassette sub-family A member 1 n=1 Tax=Galendromus occidentalis TaxID=34638 RepID=A0AAJ7SEW3_9ACAR|nr:ATP-binding cassette sub-family A member 1 [Galendromus occidentalis]